MAALRLTQAFCLLYIMVAGPTFANCARLQRGATRTQAQQRQRTETDVHGHKWCNPFSYNTVKRYHFDVQLSDKNCTDGACAAIELVRDPEKPRLVLHGGKQWTVHKIPEPTTEEPTTVEASTAAPTTAEASTAAPTTEGPTTVEASTAAPTTVAVSMLQESLPSPSEVKAIAVRSTTATPIGFHQTQAPTTTKATIGFHQTQAPTTTEATSAAPIGFHQTQAPTVAAYPVKAERQPYAEPGTLQWDLYSPGPSKAPDRHEIDLLNVNVISFFAADLENPDKLEIIITDGKTDGNHHSRNVFDLEGGLYYNEKFLQQSYDDVTAVELQKLQKSASESGVIGSSTRKGAYLGEGLAVLSVGGMYTAATIMAANVQTQALIGASLMGVVAGPIVGALTGGIVGTAVSLGMIMGGYETVKGYTIQSASSKVFEKLRCMSAFKACSHHVLVPKNKPCPRH